ncbi:nitrate- and nitrite sensing domain-containing protein [Streptomyces sp. TRM 70351]|uniref:nitrate- and nitrite sensing domain-containing protein n=1 Tax=Streptomyces sp. TRM 70351 TaxID=3116552 RepID=UPI002E7C14B2|nr:nitrate- and nitrite sensing domain-containing protein [Streptomyces sp. TRM 70351]MEE1927293.1 nitrate- and nitrite sensing domain-containing protein [Streptomyces sp. TRM 70351]
MRFRGKSIRRKIVALLLVPLVTLTSIWGFATYLTGREAKELLDAARFVAEVGHPAEDMVQTLQAERRQVLVHLGDPRRSDALTELAAARTETDRAVARMRGKARESRAGLPANSRDRLDRLLLELDMLGTAREQVENNTANRRSASAAYSAVIDPCYDLLASLHALRDATLDREGRALVGLLRAREILAREDALLASAFAAGRITPEELRDFSDRVAERRVIYSTTLPALPERDRRAFENYWAGAGGQTLASLEDAATEAGAAGALRAVNAERWDAAATTVLDDLDRLDHEAAERYAERIEPVATSVLWRAGLAGVGGFCAVLLSVVVSVRIGRGLVRDLGALRKEAHEVSGVRLPSVMRRLAAGSHVDVETEAPRLSYGPDEIGQVGQALNTLQRAAVEAAVKQADMRRGVSEVFVNLARRSQVLTHRQLALLDTMERRTEDADELADLFRLDHLTTRMRRHAEGLVILSGAAPTRQWRRPVSLMDVVRAAVAEVEDYERVEIRRLAPLTVDGPAVGDLTHLIAELLENATSFSPPHTAVQVRGERVANGFTLEIHDRGLGMTPETLLEANLRLAETPEFELSDTDRLGLFVVSRLAQRQGVRVSLQPSPYGGTTAVVLVPGSVLNEADNGAATLEGARSGEAEGPPALARVPPGSRRDLAAALGTDGRGQRGGASGRSRGGPVELDGPLDDFDDAPGGADTSAPEGIGHLLRSLHQRHGNADGALGPHRDGTGHPPVKRAENAPQHGGATPLPQRRPGATGRPVLVSDHGRPVGDHARPAGHGDRREEDRPDQADPGEQREDGPRTAQAGPGPRGPRPAGEPQPPATIGGLPRRRRQASLAPQLKEDDPPSGGGADAPGPSAVPGGPAKPPDERDAEAVRDRMAALQRGWRRGREQNDGTTPEGDGR